MDSLSRLVAGNVARSDGMAIKTPLAFKNDQSSGNSSLSHAPIRGSKLTDVRTDFVVIDITEKIVKEPPIRRWRKSRDGKYRGDVS